MQALEVWRRSPHATIFTHPEVATSLANECHWWIVRKGEETSLAWPVAIDGRGRVTIPSFSYYFGPLWSRESESRSGSGRLSERLNVYGSAVERLWQEYGTISAELHPDLLDIRAFDWWNFGQPAQPQFKISPRYSAQLLHLDTLTDSALLGGLRELRRREIRRTHQSKRFATAVCTEFDPRLTLKLLDLYCQTVPMQSQDEVTSARASIIALLGLVERGWGFMVVTRDLRTGEVASVTLTLEALGVANLVLNLTSPHHRGSGVAAATVYATILEARSRGARTFDFNGANSPRRGDDKHSYGAGEVLYFRLEMMDHY